MDLCTNSFFSRSWASTSQGHRRGRCVPRGHTSSSARVSKLQGPETQGRNFEFTSSSISAAFSGSGGASCHCRRTARAPRGGQSADPAGPSLRGLGTPQLCSDVQSAALPDPASVLTPKASASFPLFPPDSCSGPGPHLANPTCYLLGAPRGSRMRMQPKPGQKHLKPRLFMETKGRRIVGEWLSAWSGQRSWFMEGLCL